MSEKTKKQIGDAIVAMIYTIPTITILSMIFDPALSFQDLMLTVILYNVILNGISK